MYISHQGLEAIHQEIVDNGVRRSSLRRARAERRLQEKNGARARATGLRAISMRLLRALQF